MTIDLSRGHARARVLPDFDIRVTYRVTGRICGSRRAEAVSYLYSLCFLLLNCMDAAWLGPLLRQGLDLCRQLVDGKALGGHAALLVGHDQPR